MTMNAAINVQNSLDCIRGLLPENNTGCFAQHDILSQAATCDLILFYVPLCRLGQPVRLNLDQSNCSISMSALI